MTYAAELAISQAAENRLRASGIKQRDYGLYLDPIRQRLFTESSILRAAAAISIAPIESKKMEKGVFRPLTFTDIEKPLGLVAWFRAQLSAASPVLAGTEADLLLAIAAALYVKDMPRGEVSNPVGLFVSLVKRREWLKTVPYLEDARRLVDAAVAHHGDGPLGRLNTAEISVS